MNLKPLTILKHAFKPAVHTVITLAFNVFFSFMTTCCRLPVSPMGHMRSRRPHASNFSFHLYLIFSMFINLYISIYRYKIDGVRGSKLQASCYLQRLVQCAEKILQCLFINFHQLGPTAIMLHCSDWPQAQSKNGTLST